MIRSVSTGTPHNKRRVWLLAKLAIYCAALSAPVTAMAQDAPQPAWLVEANQRIAEHRMADLTVTVRDAEGEPMPNLSVSIEMTRHAFGFGTAVSVPFLAPTLSGAPDTTPDAERYRDKIIELFNLAVMENGHKWSFWENKKWHDRTVTVTEWLLDQGLRVRGHALIWQQRNRGWALPDDVYDSTDPKHIRQRIAEHIHAVAKFSYAGHGPLEEWDVLNEQWSEHQLTDLLSPDVPKEHAPDLVTWFKQAAAAAPQAHLIINDFGILTGDDPEHRDSYEKTIQHLLDQGAPLRGIGFQSHFGHGHAVNEPEETLKRLNRFARFGLPLTVTEFDQFGDGWTPEKRATALSEFLTVCFSHPQVNGFLIWGFWDGRHWKNSAPLFNRDWSLKPEGKAYMNLVFSEWWTRKTVATDARGQAATRGFLGDYLLTARTPDGREAVARVSLDSLGKSVGIDFAPAPNEQP
ncbi:MAG: endo-1,4-beta-xylanase [Planctomycetota bacterium]